MARLLSSERVAYRARFSRAGGMTSWRAALFFQSSGRLFHPRSFQYAKLLGLSWLERLSLAFMRVSYQVAEWISATIMTRGMTAVSPNLADKTRNRLGGARFSAFPLGTRTATRLGISAGTVAVWGIYHPSK